MAKKTKISLLDIIKHFVDIAFNRIKSTPGRINITFGFLMILVIIVVLFQPIVFYILQMFQALLNFILVILEKEQIPLSDSANTITVLVICLITVIVESVLCSLLVYWGESKRRERFTSRNGSK